MPYGANPSLRIPGGDTAFGGGFANPSSTRTWTDANGNFVPDCDLTNPLAQSPTTGSIDTCGQIDNLLFGSNQFVGANFDPGLLSGWGVRPSDWSFGVSVQQQIFPRASVEVGYYRRSFTQFTTGGTVTDNLAISPNDRRRVLPHGAERPASARRRRLPGRPAVQPDPGGVRPGPNNLLIRSTRTSATTRACSTAWT